MILLADGEGIDQTAVVQAGLGLCCPHMPKEMFSHDPAQIIYCISEHRFFFTRFLDLS